MFLINPHSLIEVHLWGDWLVCFWPEKLAERIVKSLWGFGFIRVPGMYWIPYATSLKASVFYTHFLKKKRAAEATIHLAHSEWARPK